MEELLGKNVVMTGRFDQGREVLKTHFERLGAKFQTSVCPDTDILLVGKQPGIKMLDKFDNLRGAGYDIAIWEQKDINRVWHENYAEHMTQEDIEEDERKFKALIGDSEDEEEPEEEKLYHSDRWIFFTPIWVFLVELVVLFIFMLIVASAGWNELWAWSPVLPLSALGYWTAHLSEIDRSGKNVWIELLKLNIIMIPVAMIFISGLAFFGALLLIVALCFKRYRVP